MADSNAHHSFEVKPYPVAIVLAIVSALGIVLNILPFVWHLQNRNIPVGSLLFWVLILNIMNCCNAIIWPDDDLYNAWPGYGLCDLQVKLVVGSWGALPACVAAIMRNLTLVLDVKSGSIGSADKTTRTHQRLLDAGICWLPAVYLMAVHYIVQPFRYYLYGISGCQPSFHNSWPSYVLVFACPLAIALVAAGYVGLVSFRVHQYRRQFASLLSGSSVSKSRFIRLYVICLALICTLIPMHAYIFAEHLFVKMDTYSWTKVHAHWNQVYPIFSHGIILFDRWIRPAVAVVVFFCFGLGQDARQKYYAWLVWLRLARMPQRTSDSRTSTGTRSSTSSLKHLKRCISEVSKRLSLRIFVSWKSTSTNTDSRYTGSVDSDTLVSWGSSRSTANPEEICVTLDKDLEHGLDLFEELRSGKKNELV